MTAATLKQVVVGEAAGLLGVMSGLKTAHLCEGTPSKEQNETEASTFDNLGKSERD